MSRLSRHIQRQRDRDRKIASKQALIDELHYRQALIEKHDQLWPDAPSKPEDKP